jgi:hypothetical protein
MQNLWSITWTIQNKKKEEEEWLCNKQKWEVLIQKSFKQLWADCTPLKALCFAPFIKIQNLTKVYTPYIFLSVQKPNPRRAFNPYSSEPQRDQWKEMVPCTINRKILTQAQLKSTLESAASIHKQELTETFPSFLEIKYSYNPFTGCFPKRFASNKITSHMIANSIVHFRLEVTFSLEHWDDSDVKACINSSFSNASCATKGILLTLHLCILLQSLHKLFHYLTEKKGKIFSNA